jgi:hypothetical protein
MQLSNALAQTRTPKIRASNNAARFAGMLNQGYCLRILKDGSFASAQKIDGFGGPVDLTTALELVALPGVLHKLEAVIPGWSMDVDRADWYELRISPAELEPGGQSRVEVLAELDGAPPPVSARNALPAGANSTPNSRRRFATQADPRFSPPASARRSLWKRVRDWLMSVPSIEDL